MRPEKSFRTVYALLIFLFIVGSGSSLSAQHAVYYVSTAGNDNNPGTVAKPFATWQKAINKAVAGDTIYLRGGIYRFATSSSQMVSITASGTAENPICLFAYKGEKPVLDGSLMTSGGSYRAISINGANYWHLKGIEIRNLPQKHADYLPQGIAISNSRHCIFEQLNIHRIGGFGIYLVDNNDDNLILNCDLHHIWDSLSASGNGVHADGIRISYIKTGQVNKVKGCRIWNCSDDGMDCFYNDGYLTVEGCWSFNNGLASGGGNGFKFGPQLSNVTRDTLRYIINNLSFYNKHVGFTSNAGKYSHLYYNNIAYHNGMRGFQDFDDDIPDTWKNNIDYVNALEIALDPGDAIDEYNSWNTAVHITVSDDDFISIDTAGVTGSRKPDGSLPDLSFLKPAKGSDLIDAGIRVGLPYEGTAPDLGAYEYRIPVTTITVSGAGGSSTISTDDGTLQLSAAILPSYATNKNVKWSVINGSGQASISSTGLVTALDNGIVTARATASDGSGVYGTLTITISNQVIPVTGIAVTGASGVNTITADDGTLQLNAAISPNNATNKNLTWSLVNSAEKAVINAAGLISAIDNGTVTARATANDGSGVYGTLTITISNQVIPVTGIAVTGVGGVNSILTDDGTLQLSAAVLPANATNRNVTWSVVNITGQATINSNGQLTAVDNGTVTARATTNDGSGVYGSLTITISNQTIPVSAIHVIATDNDTIINTEEDSLQLNAVVLPDNATCKSVTWTVENITGKAVIDSAGLIIATEDGVVKARATANDGSGVYGTMTITIERTTELPVGSEIVYIDPDNTGDLIQDGTMDHPYSSWSMVTWQEGYTYLQKKGTVAHDFNININASRVTMGSYGEGYQPVIRSNVNDFTVRIFGRKNIVIKDLSIKAENAISCIYIMGESDSITIENCRLENAFNGVRILDGRSMIMRYNSFSGCTDAIYCYAESSLIYYNVFMDNDIAINMQGIMKSTGIYNNVFYNNKTGISNTDTKLTLFNNIFYLAKSGDKAIHSQLNRLVSDNNIFYPEQSGFIQIGSKVYGSIDEYQHELGLDLNSITDDPEFVDAINQNYSISPNSPAINAGKLLDLEQDFYGTQVPLGGLPDIGLAELNTGSVTSVFNQLNDRVSDDFQVYPNPSRGIFNVYVKKSDLSNSRVTIKDMTGRTVYETIYNSDYDFLKEIDFSSVKKGLYIVTAEDKSRSLSQPIIIK